MTVSVLEAVHSLLSLVAMQLPSILQILTTTLRQLLQVLLQLLGD